MSRRRQREEQARLLTILGGTPWPTWPARLQALAADEAPQAARSLLRAYRHGLLGLDLWAGLTGQPPRDHAEIADAVRQLWDSFFAADLVPRSSVGDWSQTITRGLLYRWAWQPRWHLVDQDEDLMIMDERWMPVLLEIAGDRRAPKRDYILQIVAHHSRDWACQAVYAEAADAPATFARLAAWAPLARAADAPELADYLGRLGAYARERRVDAAAAVQFFLDLGRCSQPPLAKIDVRPVPGGYAGTIVHSGGDRRFRLDARTGALTCLTPPKRRRR